MSELHFIKADEDPKPLPAFDVVAAIDRLTAAIEKQTELMYGTSMRNIAILEEMQAKVPSHQHTHPEAQP